MSRTLLFAGCLGSEQQRPAIRVYDFDAAACVATSIFETSEVDAPSFTAIDTAARRVYVASETSDGSIVAFDLDARTGRLSEIGRQSSRGDSPCHIGVDRTRRFAFVSNFAPGTARSATAQSLAVLPVNPALKSATTTMRHEGSGPVRPHQDNPHAHCAVASPDNRFVLVSDFGTDEVICYPFDQESGRLSPPAGVCRMPPGSAPRTLSFAADGRTVFVSAELKSSVATLNWDAATGHLGVRAMDSTLPPGVSIANFPSEILLRHDGRFLYVGNRGHESIAVFSVSESGLRFAGAYPSGGSWPRFFCQSDDGNAVVVANQKTGEIVLFAADPDTGALAMRGVIARAAAPAFVGLATFE